MKWERATTAEQRIVSFWKDNCSFNRQREKETKKEKWEFKRERQRQNSVLGTLLHSNKGLIQNTLPSNRLFANVGCVKTNVTAENSGRKRKGP